MRRPGALEGMGGKGETMNIILVSGGSSRARSIAVGTRQIVIFALLSGGAVFGLLGIVLAVPVAATMRLVLIYVRAKLRDEDPYPPLTEELAAATHDGAEHPGSPAVRPRVRAQP